MKWFLAYTISGAVGGICLCSYFDVNPFIGLVVGVACGTWLGLGEKP